MQPASEEASSETTDPLRRFFDELGHRLDLYRTLVPVGHAWPILNVHDLYLAWIRDSHNRHEARLLRERLGFLREENDQLRRALVESREPKPEAEGIPAMSDHHANGRIVAQVRRWLETLNNAAEDYGDMKTLSCLISSSGFECELTVDHVRTLLAEHDSYRNEARTQPISDEPKLWSASRPCDRFATENDRKAFLGMFPGDKLDQFTPEFAAYVRTGELAGEQPQIPAWDIAALDQLPPADRIDYITDRLAADFKNKTTNVGVAILLLRNLAEEMRETSSPALAAPKHSEPEDPFDRLVRLTETHLRKLTAANFSAPLVDRLRRDNCTHDWSASKPLSGYHDEIECLKCGLHVIDGYRPYYPKGNGS